MKPLLSVQTWALFVEAAREQSLSETARRHGLAPSTLSRRLTQLEEEMGERLFLRTEHGLHLTEFGARAYALAAPLVSDLADSLPTKEAASEPGKEMETIEVCVHPLLSMQNILRAATTYARGRAASFVFSRTSLDCTDKSCGSSLTQQPVNGESGSSRLRVLVRAEVDGKSQRHKPKGVKRIGRFLAASAQYAKFSDLPLSPMELNQHVVLEVASDVSRLSFAGDTQVFNPAVRFEMPDYDALFQALLQGAGIGLVQENETVERLLADGTLTRILPDWKGADILVSCEGDDALLCQLVSFALNEAAAQSTRDSSS